MFAILFCIESSALFLSPQILVIAFLMKFVMKRTFNLFQWEALFVLVAGITVNQLNYCKGGSTENLLAPAAVM